MVRRGLTLLEIVIALALVLSITAMVAPPVLRRLDERSFTAACDLLSQQMLLARAHAQATGSGVEVVHDPETRITRARMFVALPPDQGDPLDASLAGGDDDAARAITEPWSERMLHDGLSITDVDPREDDEALFRTSFEPFDDALGPTAQLILESLRLAVFLPDGSALLGAPIWVKDDDGRIARLTTNPLTGLVSIERLDGSFADDEETFDDEEDAPRDEVPDEERGRDEPGRGTPGRGAPDPPADDGPEGSGPPGPDGDEDLEGGSP